MVGFGRVGSGRVESGRVGSGCVCWCSVCFLSGRVGSGRVESGRVGYSHARSRCCKTWFFTVTPPLGSPNPRVFQPSPFQMHQFLAFSQSDRLRVLPNLIFLQSTTLDRTKPFLGPKKTFHDPDDDDESDKATKTQENAQTSTNRDANDAEGDKESDKKRRKAREHARISLKSQETFGNGRFPTLSLCGNTFSQCFCSPTCSILVGVDVFVVAASLAQSSFKGLCPCADPER